MLYTINFCFLGNYAWQMYTGRNFLGQEVVMVPGYYDAAWLAEHIGTNSLSSLKSKYRPQMSNCNFSLCYIFHVFVIMSRLWRNS